jgi:hypothetical protein
LLGIWPCDIVAAQMDTQKRTARTAGLWYLAMAASGPIALVYAPSKIFIDGDVAATAANLTAHQLLLRVGVLSGLICQVSFVFLVLALRRLFQGINDAHARLMVALVIAAVPIAIANDVFSLAALELVSGADYLRSLAPEQRNTLAVFLLRVHQFGVSIVELFWGLWLFPFAALVIRSGFIPRVFGVLLAISGFAYVIECVAVLFAPQHRGLIGDVLTLPMAAGELSMVLWLLVKGVRAPAAPAPSRPLPA